MPMVKIRYSGPGARQLNTPRGNLLLAPDRRGDQSKLKEEQVHLFYPHDAGPREPNEGDMQVIMKHPEFRSFIRDGRVRLFELGPNGGSSDVTPEGVSAPDDPQAAMREAAAVARAVGRKRAEAAVRDEQDRIERAADEKMGSEVKSKKGGGPAQ